MLLDHLAVCFVSDESWMYTVMRAVGRSSYVIFAFLIVQGFLYTHDAWKYELRILLFALISEVPFDLAFSGSFIKTESQNVFFTLALGLLSLILSEKVRNRVQSEGTHEGRTVASLLSLLPVGLCALVSALISSDYGAAGVIMIYLFYYFRRSLAIQLACFFVVAFVFFGPFEWYGAAAFFLLYFYHGRRGPSARYFFYAFYPVHLLIIGIAEILIGK